MCMRWLMSELSWSHSSLSLNLARERLKKCKSERERKTKTSEWIIYDGEWRLNGNCLKPATAFAFIIDSAFNFHSKRHLTSLLLIKNLSLPLSLPKTRQWSIASLLSERFYFNFSNYSLQVSEPWRALSIKRDTTRRKIWFSFLLLSITKSRLFRKNEMQVFTERGKKKTHTAENLIYKLLRELVFMGTLCVCWVDNGFGMMTFTFWYGNLSPTAQQWLESFRLLNYSGLGATRKCTNEAWVAANMISTSHHRQGCFPKVKKIDSSLSQHLH